MKKQLFCLWAVLLLSSVCVFAQQPQVSEPNPQSLQGINGKWVNGVAPGYYPTCSPLSCSGTLTLSVGPGTCFDSSGTRHAYAGGTLTMTGSSTNYVYLDGSNCSLTKNTTGYPTSGIMPIATVTATSTITAIVDDRTWFGGAGGTGGGAGGNAIKECIVTTGDPGAASPALANDNDSPAQCGNDFGADLVITAVACWADAGSPTITPILTGGSSTSILTSALTCGTASWAAGTVNGTPTIHTFGSDGASCGSTPCTLDSNITTAGGVAKYIVVKYTATTTGGTTTPLSLGTCANHQPCYNNSGTLGGIAPGTNGQPITSVGTSSTPVAQGCLLSNGVIAKTSSYTLLTADNGSLITFNGSSLTATLPNPPPSSTWCANIINLNSGSNLTISRNGLSINTGTSNLTLLPYQLATIWTDGSNYFSTLPLSGVTTTTASQSAGAGTVTTTGSPANGNLAKFSGPSSITNADLSGDATTSGTPAVTVVKVNGGSIPTSATALASNGSNQLVAATYQGNGSKVQLSTGTTTTNDCVKFDANGNTVDAGAACGTGGGGSSNFGVCTPSFSSTTGYTWDNQGASTATITSNVLTFTAQATSGQDQIRYFHKAVPSTPWTLIMCFAPDVRGFSNNIRSYFAISDGTKIIVWGWRMNEFDVFRFNSSNNSFNATSFSQSYYVSSPIALCITDDGTNLIYGIALDGSTCRQIFSESRTAFFASGPTTVGVAAESTNTNNTVMEVFSLQ